MTPPRALPSSEDAPIFADHLESFATCPALRARIIRVLQALPSEVQRDLLDDPRFRITLEDYQPGKGWTLWMAVPSPSGEASRCVVLRTRLGHCGEAFGLYVIAHELAHAYLRNGGWGAILDREEAADALAARWGFPRPS